MRSIRTLSLFSGAGGLDLGFHEAGFDIIGCLEIDTPSCDTLGLNIGKYVSTETKIFNADITLTEPASLDVGEIDFIIGGPPCQSFSAAGRRAGGVHGINDTRGSLFWYYCKYLEYFKPAGFLFENVKGILQANNSSDWDIILKSFESVGYTVNFKILDAADFGTPQHRERLIMVGVRNDLAYSFLFPSPTHGPAGDTSKEYVTPWMAIGDFYSPDEVVPPYGGKYGHLLNDIPPGMNYLYYTEKFGHANPLFAWRSKFSGFLYKLPKNEPSKTVVAHQGRYDGPFHWNNRKLTIPELKRIQGFPDDYQFVSSKVEAVRQIGNSVAPRMGRKLADAVKLQFFGANDVFVSLSQESDTSHHSKRKAVKAASTKGKTKKDSFVGADQLDLFAEPKVYDVDLSFDREVSSSLGSYQIDGSLKSGIWHISMAPTTSLESVKVSSTLKFSNPAGCNFNTIVVEASLSELHHIAIFWDAIHHAIEMSSSYEGLLPLYGHFTEPHPKFQLGMDILHLSSRAGLEEKIANLILCMSDFSFLSTLHRYADFFDNSQQASEALQTLRSIGYDIRTHETNRAIKEGFFKPCYPFSLYTKTNTYTVWRDKGTHRTGDVRVNVTDGKVTIS
ncbi:DNA cytosine methyltransferase [Tabrizicola sp.]|uniref:DNA cytosine methyltransferase n=1 Tax=Tabrizicola sp. TaxID=2005166 RepID=UPI002610E6CD|nr:DNA cytosine methyltransferase [Tabrizicola sp.]MDM7930896.1 DNA cytosine methyltransferase [Tabrizicola sp.]